jgi:predicted transcriptional regulator
MDGSPKQVALKMIEQMPPDASLENIMYELYFRQRVDSGLQEFDAGKTIPHQEAKQSLAQRLQSPGQ